MLYDFFIWFSYTCTLVLARSLKEAFVPTGFYECEQKRKEERESYVYFWPLSCHLSESYNYLELYRKPVQRKYFLSLIWNFSPAVTREHVVLFKRIKLVIWPCLILLLSRLPSSLGQKVEHCFVKAYKRFSFRCCITYGWMKYVPVLQIEIQNEFRLPHRSPVFLCYRVQYNTISQFIYQSDFKRQWVALYFSFQFQIEDA